MPKLMKPPTQGKDAETGIYDGDPPTPGLYQGKLVWLGIGTVKTGDNAGGQRLSVLVQITEGKFKGASVSTGFSFGAGDGYINQFLDSLTDGSKAQRDGIRTAFWDTGYLVDDEKNGVFPIVRIGKKTNPVGMPCAFVTKMRHRDDTDEDVADIAKFVVKRKPEGDDDTDDSTDDDGADGFTSALEEASLDDDASEDDPEPAGDDGDDDTVAESAGATDDPWSV